MICPYCKHVSTCRSMHITHLKHKHADAYAHNVATSRGVTIGVVPGCPPVADNTFIGPVQSNVQTPPSAAVSALPYTVYCTVCISYNNSWVKAPSSMEPRCMCSSCHHWQCDRCEHANRYTRLYCRGGKCQHPHGSPGYDDRIRDWGCYGRVNNVHCQGHLPRLCPIDSAWLSEHFTSTSRAAISSTSTRTRTDPTFESIVLPLDNDADEFLDCSVIDGQDLIDLKSLD